MNHTLYVCPGGAECAARAQGSTACPYCDGGLQVCKTCGGAHVPNATPQFRTLTTHCPGKAIAFTDLQRVHRGELDYT